MNTPNTPNAAERPSDASIAKAFEYAKGSTFAYPCDPGSVFRTIEQHARELDAQPHAATSAGPVGRVEKHTGSLKDMAIIVWLQPQPPEGTLLYTSPQPPAPGAVSDEGVLVARLRGRALFLRKLGRVKSPSLMELAADALGSFAKRRVVAKGDRHG